MASQVIKDSVNKMCPPKKRFTKAEKEAVSKTSAEHAGLPSVDQKSREIYLVISQGAPAAPVAAAPAPKPRAKRVMTEEQKQAARERLVKARAVKQEKAALKK